MKPFQSGNQQYGNQQNDYQQYGNQPYGNQQYGNQQYGNQQFGNQQGGIQQYGNQGNQQYGNQGNQQYGNQGNQQYGNQGNQQYGNQGNQQYGKQQDSNQQYGNQQQYNYQPPPNPYEQQSNNYPPVSADPYTTSSAEKFVKTSKYKDVWASILFFLTLIAFGICAYFGVSAAQNNFNQPNGALGNLSATDIISLVIIAVGGGFLLSLIYFALIQKFAGTLIKIQAALYIAALLAFTAYLAFQRQYVGAIILFIITLLFAYVIWSWRSRIPFAKLMLKTVTRIISQYPSTIWVGVIGLLLQSAFATLFFFTSFGWVLRIQAQNTTNAQGKTTNSNSALYAIYIFLLFTLYWTTQVIKSTVHVTVSGVFATYYFMGITDNSGNVSVPVDNPTSASAKRALTTSFGSIWFAYFTIRSLIRMAANQSAQDGNMVGYFCALCAGCLLDLIEGLVQYFNTYAFTQVAIYGKDYCSAAKATWALIKRRGIDAIINDNLIGLVISMGSLFIGLITGVFGYIFFLFSAIPKNEPGYPIAIFLICAIIGACEFLVLGEVIESGTVTTFVCMAEDPETLRRSKPELYQKVVEVYPQVQFS